ncbi:MAG: DUF1501 domain-containing protein [Candidatus Kapaibacteriota bacterium]
MKRRTLLKAGALAGAAASFGSIPIFAQNPIGALGAAGIDNDAILIIIQMFGGNDGLNTIIPADDPEYIKIRPNIAVRADNPITNRRPKKILNSDVYFHPALVDGVHRNGFLGLIEEGRLAVIQGTGYENPNLSHFRSTDIWLSGLNDSNGETRLNEGWIGRLFENNYPDFPIVMPDHPLCLQLGGSLSMLLQSDKGDMGLAIGDVDQFVKEGSTGSDFPLMNGTTPYDNEYNYIRSIAKKGDIYNKVIEEAWAKGINAPGIDYAISNGAKGSLVRQMGIISKLISGGLKTKVYLAQIGGFDTHVQQQDMNNNGQHPALLNQLANAISIFMDDAVKQGFANRVVGLTVSEVGRRPYENGSNGTDHGTTSVQFAFGTRVQANVFGANPDFSDLDNNGDLAFDLNRNIDYRRLYSEIIQTWFGGSAEDSKSILNERVVPLPYLQSPISSLNDPIMAYGNNGIRYSENYNVPNSGNIHVEVKKDCHIQIRLYNSLGTYSGDLFNGYIQAGKHVIPVDVSQFTSGMYICELSSGMFRHTTSLFVRR